MDDGEVAKCLSSDLALNLARRCMGKLLDAAGCQVLWDPRVGEAALSMSLAGESCVLQEPIVIATLRIGGKHAEKLCRNLVLEKLSTAGTECWRKLCPAGAWLARHIETRRRNQLPFQSPSSTV